MNNKLDAYFGNHFLPFVVKEIIVGVSQIVWAALDCLFWVVTGFLFFGLVVPVLRVTGLEEPFKRFVASLMEKKSARKRKAMFLKLKQQTKDGRP